MIHECMLPALKYAHVGAAALGRLVERSSTDIEIIGFPENHVS
jgi:hypothetical protein